MISIKRCSQFLEIIGIALIPVAVLELLLKWFPATPMLIRFMNGFFEVDSLNKLNISSMPFAHRALGCAVDSIATLLFVVGIVCTIRIMRHFQKEEFFIPNVINLFSRLSSVALAWALYNPIKGGLLSVITSWHNGPGHRILSISLGSDDLIHSAIVIFFVLFTYLLRKGYMLQHEQDLTI